MNGTFNFCLLGATLALWGAHASFAQEAPGTMAWQSPLVTEDSVDEDPEALENDSKLIQINPTFDEAVNGKVQVITFRKPKDFNYEFTLLVVNGKIRRTFIVSTAIPGKHPILGIHRMNVLKQKNLPWPWITSHTYDNSPMYWGVNIHGGYFIHSSPHYGNLGRPASMGCIRTSLPDAMEVFNTIANEFPEATAYSMVFENIAIHAQTAESQLLNQVLTTSGMTIDQLKAAIEQSHQEVIAVSKKDLAFGPGIPADAHARPFTGQQSDASLFPKCGGEDCWSVFHKRPAIVKLSPLAMGVF